MKNQGAGMFEKGLKKSSPDIFVLTQKMWQRYGCRMEIVIVWLEGRVERDETDTGGMGQRELKRLVKILCWMRCVPGSQCRLWRIGWLLVDFLALHTSFCDEFWTFWSLSSKYWGLPESRELQKSNRERTREQTRVFLLDWWEGAVLNWIMIRLIYVCCFATVTCVLWHAEILI